MVLVSTYAPVNGRSVAPFRSTAYSWGVSVARHSSSVLCSRWFMGPTIRGVQVGAGAYGVRMAEEPAELQVGERVVRVSSPGREIFPAHDGAAPVSKLAVVQYYVAVGEQILRATHERPTTL